MNKKIRKECIDIIKKLQDNEHEAYLVGGCVRDIIMDNTPHDFDITTSATPEEVMNLFDKTIPTGIAYGTVTVIIDGVGYEITTFRKDQLYSDGRRPDTITFSKSINEDLARRDFTINAIAYNPLNNEIVDPFCGVDDITNKILRAVGNPYERIKEDVLRILRGYRFATKYSLDIDKMTLEAMQNNLNLINEKISKERINNELFKILESSLELKDLELLWDVFEVIFPILKETKGYDQENPHHDLSLDKHILKSVANVSNLKKMNFDCFKNINLAELRLALLLHDVGKIYVKTYDENNIAHYYGHAEYSAQISEKYLKQLKFSNKTIDNVVNLIANHQITFPTTEKGMIKFINKHGIDNVYLYLAIYCADKMSHSNSIKECEIENLIKKIKDASIEPMAKFSLKDLAINGNDVIRETNAQGCEIGILLEQILSLVIDGKLENTKEQLIEFIKKYRFV